MSPAEIAAGLNRDGREIIKRKGLAYGDKPFFASVLRPYERRGLFYRVERKGFATRWRLTPLGLEVRAILLARAEAQP